MSIPQICQSCGEHITQPHAKDCCYGTPEYAHIGWPGSIDVTGSLTIPMQGPCSHLATGVGSTTISQAEMSLHTHTHSSDPDTASAIRRLLEYLNDEPIPERHHNEDAILLLTKRSEELRKEAAGMYNVDAKAKRVFAADVLENLIAELSA